MIPPPRSDVYPPQPKSAPRVYYARQRWVLLRPKKLQTPVGFCLRLFRGSHRARTNSRAWHAQYRPWGGRQRLPRSHAVRGDEGVWFAAGDMPTEGLVVSKVTCLWTFFVSERVVVRRSPSPFFFFSDRCTTLVA